MSKTALAKEYAEKLIPYQELATKAYGSRDLDSPAHRASREYTKLIVEFYEKGGSLSKLGEEIGASYPSLRRRVLMSSTDVSTARPPIKVKNSDVSSAVKRVIDAKAIGVEAYHDQLAYEYSSGVSLSKIAKELGLSSAAPLYYGVQRSIQRKSVFIQGAISG